MTPDLAVLAVPPDTVPGLVAELAARGCRAAVVVADRLGPSGGPDGEALRAAMLAAARPGLLRLVGPNSLGILSPAAGLNASLTPAPPAAGDIAFLTQ